MCVCVYMYIYIYIGVFLNPALYCVDSEGGGNGGAGHGASDTQEHHDRAGCDQWHIVFREHQLKVHIRIYVCVCVCVCVCIYI